MPINVHLRNVNEKLYRLFKSAAAKRSVSLSKAFEEAISAWVSRSEEASEKQAENDITYKKMKKQLEKRFSGKCVVIADGKFLGAEDSLENAWALASHYENAVVTRITRKPMRAKILGSSLRMAPA
ncbi:MAG: hypothetical protein O8C66_06390 [Candidatus Methanoperedens sp.]|nr:hypothetical protein [Candidatus Methanoperedens sp.]MCZ7370119.1 hypothetical protein [Candidatus Methanoperedens sp.]